MSDGPRFLYVTIPKFLLDPPEKYPNMTASHLATYLAARSFAYVSARANDRFGKCMASQGSIAKRARQSLATVKRNLRDLEAWHLIYRAGRATKYRQTVILCFVDFPDRFERTLEVRGLEAAKDEETERMDVVREKARKQAAKLAAMAHPETTRNRWRQNDVLPPIPHYIPFANRGHSSSQSPTWLKNDGDIGHGEPSKNAVGSEEQYIKNTSPSEVALIESDPDKSNSGATTTVPQSDPVVETQEQKIARFRDLMNHDPDFQKARP